MHHRHRSHRRRPFDEAGHAHMLTFSCYRRYRFLTSERTCGWLAEATARARDRWGFALWAYVFMPEHVHLIVQPGCPAAPIASILKAIKQPVGRQAFAYLEAQGSSWCRRLTRTRGGRTERLFWQLGGGYDQGGCVT